MVNSINSSTVVGNGKSVKGKLVRECLTVVGNNNKIDIAKNQGKIKVIGNNCHLNIHENIGDVVLIGNHGVVNVWGPPSSERVTCTGEGCSINFKDSSGQCKTEFSTTSQKVLGDFSLKKIIDVSDVLSLGGINSSIR